jgi:uncharacterized membrane protein
MEIYQIIEIIAEGIEALGVAVILVGTLYAFIAAFKNEPKDRYMMLRQRIGKAILLGLEILVGADIIMTITTQPTLRSVLVLGIVVIIRTFLSFSLEAELEGRWPWQKSSTNDKDS